MTSFESFQINKIIKKSTFYFYFLYFFLLRYIMGDKLNHFMVK